jgi:Ni,Fe-hydrogenase III small subunit/formate hydrogenlyase subunit 6/NADH:ubiquinone oxidoreductase subunit I
MIEWIARGLRSGIVTTRYPKRPEHPPADFRGRVDVLQTEHGASRIADICPTGAIGVDETGHVSLDRGRCILCGLCVAAGPDRFAFAGNYETASRSRAGLVAGEPPLRTLDELRATLGERSRTLRRSIHIRHVDAGSDGGEEWEIQALTNPYYDMQRLGFFFTLSPRHADILLVTGTATESMRAPLLRAWETMPEPKAVVAAGTDACTGGLTGATAGGIDTVLPVDVYVPGSPPSPIAILHGLLLATGVLTREAAA